MSEQISTQFILQRYNKHLTYALNNKRNIPKQTRVHPKNIVRKTTAPKSLPNLYPTTLMNTKNICYKTAVRSNKPNTTSKIHTS